MDSEPPPVPNAFLSSPITRFQTTETQPTSFPASFQTSHTSSSVFAATSPTFLSALSDLQDEGSFVDYLLSSTASENLLTAPVAKKARKFAPPKSSKEVEQARKETIPKKHSLTSSITYYYVLLLWLLSYLDQIFAT